MSDTKYFNGRLKYTSLLGISPRKLNADLHRAERRGLVTVVSRLRLGPTQLAIGVSKFRTRKGDDVRGPERILQALVPGARPGFSGRAAWFDVTADSHLWEAIQVNVAQAFTVR